MFAVVKFIYFVIVLSFWLNYRFTSCWLFNNKYFLGYDCNAVFHWFYCMTKLFS